MDVQTERFRVQSWNEAGCRNLASSGPNHNGHLSFHTEQIGYSMPRSVLTPMSNHTAQLVTTTGSIAYHRKYHQGVIPAKCLYQPQSDETS